MMGKDEEKTSNRVWKSIREGIVPKFRKTESFSRFILNKYSTLESEGRCCLIQETLFRPCSRIFNCVNIFLFTVDPDSHPRWIGKWAAKRREKVLNDFLAHRAFSWISFISYRVETEREKKRRKEREREWKKNETRKYFSYKLSRQEFHENAYKSDTKTRRLRK